MAEWWDGLPGERYWCEVTDREDVGANLWCPQTDESGELYWSYSLIHAIAPGDIVFHYSTKRQAFVGASVAGGPVETRQIVWAPHGTVGVRKKEPRVARPGWWRPLYGYSQAEGPLTLTTINSPENQPWVRAWAESRALSSAARLPFQLYPKNLRGAQGYLTKMPQEFVKRWAELSSLEERLTGVQERLAPMAEWYSEGSEAKETTKAETVKIKSADDYFAFIQGGQQRRTRNHERLIARAVRELEARGAELSTPHPIDLRIIKPSQVIVEAKLVRAFGPILAIRAAVGQLFEYRAFRGPKEAALCILLDADPGTALVEYVEGSLGLLIMWLTAEGLFSGPATAARLPALKITVTG